MSAEAGNLVAMDVKSADAAEHKLDMRGADVETASGSIRTAEHKLDTRDADAAAMSMRSVSLFNGRIYLNPVATLSALCLLIFISAWCLGDESTYNDDESLKHTGAFDQIGIWKVWVSTHFTWLYVISQNAWLAVLVYIVYKFGSMKLGTDDSVPEFSDQAYFAMIFSCGIGTGLFFYGVGEPLFHYTGQFERSRYQNMSFISQDEEAQAAINLTMFHWGILGWVTYSLMGMQMALMTYRHGLPLSMRSTLFPMLGRHTFGYIGDLVDGSTIVVIVAGVVTDLGLGADQIVTGLIRLDILSAAEDPADQSARVTCIWLIIAIAAASAMTGVERGIKVLSQTALVLSSLLMVSVLFADNTEFLLNLIVQSIGYHLQWLLQLSFATDAWAQLKEVTEAGAKAFSGRSTDGDSASVLWMDSWTIFYWGWWIAWAPFVGMFLARISKGRTIRNMVMYTMTIPFFYILLWFCIFGGAGIRMERRAQEIQKAFYPNYDASAGDSNCFAVPADAQEPGISPVCLFQGDASAAWFDVLTQYGNIGSILNFMSCVAMIIYFVTSSDSGSLIMDALASNGSEKHSPAQRVVWAVAQGVVATVLLLRGTGVSLLYAFQPLLVVLGLPYQVMLCLGCAGLLKALFRDEQYRANGINGYLLKLDEPRNGHFKTPVHGGVFDVFEWVFSLGRPLASRGYGGLSLVLFGRTALALVLPFVPAFMVSRAIGEPKLTSMATTASIAATWVGTVASVITYLSIGAKPDNFVGILAIMFYSCFVFLLARLRSTFRTEYSIHDGNSAEDFCLAFCFYPMVLAQMIEHSNALPLPLADKNT
ncbi:unnamed protein product [Polarella glacialis]|uniref:Uncharacterized protein n=1 Tax=Polarella glacialis TaxID=89957 RepID=A0A813FLM1_POLGL|nr:unnamed protein product [Polarella glacialis]CAE8645809.1 unnamed protein product [Polarella glacialis]